MHYEAPGQAEARHDEKVWLDQNSPRNLENEEVLREKVARLNDDIAARQASIEKLVAQMQEGERKAQGNEKLMALNEQLQAEAQAQKVKLLEEVENISREKKAAEEELAQL